MSVKCLIYCTKAYPYLTRGNSGKTYPSCAISNGILDWHLNGKIVASFDCEKVDYYQMEYHKNNLVMNDISIYDEFESKEWGHDCFNRVISNEYSDEEIANCELIKKSCLSFDELGKYVCPKNGIDNFYAIHISNLKIFDKPKEVRGYKGECINKKWSYCPSCEVGYEYISEDEAEFYRAYGTCSTEWVCLNWLKKAPQNMCYCYDQERKTQYVLISIRPEWVAKILTGKKTIEVRKKVVNALKELV